VSLVTVLPVFNTFQITIGALLGKVFAETILTYRWVILIAALVIAGVAGSGVRYLSISTEPRDNFGPENPQLLAFEELESTFSRIENVFIVIAPDDGQVFTPRVLGLIKDLTEDAWKTPYVKRVDSLVNYQHTEAFEDDLLVNDLVEFPEELSLDDLIKIRDVAMNEPLVVNRLISADGKVAGINIDFHIDKSDADAQLKSAAWVREKKAEIMSAYPDVKVYATGTIMISAAFSETALRDLQTQTPLMYLFIVVLMVLLLRSITGVIGIVVTTMLSIVSAMGMAGWLGMEISPMSSSTPTIILTVVVAHGIHVMVAYYQSIRAGCSKQDSMLGAIDINLQPVFLTSVSTLIGFLSLNVLADVPPIQDLGNMVAIGVVFAFFYSLTVLPVVVYLLPNRVKPGNSLAVDSMGKFAELVIARRQVFLTLSGIAAVVLMSMAPLNIISDRFSKYFGEETDLRIDTDFTDENLGGLYRIEYSLDTGKAQGISNPQYLKTVESFARWFRDQPEVHHVNTYTDIMKRLNKNLHNDDPTYYSLPETQNLSAQYLLLYELSLPFGLDLTNQVNFDKSSTRMAVSLPSMGTPDFIDLQERGKAWLAENAPEMVQEGSGLALMFTHIGIRAMKGSIQGASMALVLIAIVLVLSLRSVKMGMISLIPNMLPGISGFGVWYLVSGTVGQSMSMVLGITMGIVVDDTVHFLSKYLRARREQGLSSEDAVRYAFRSVGVALWITTLVLVAGFLMLGTSDFRMNGDMGIMVAIVITIALIFDFLLLPPLLMLLDTDGPENTAG
jgi:predicted RND superfamily exporter protein